MAAVRGEFISGGGGGGGGLAFGAAVEDKRSAAEVQLESSRAADVVAVLLSAHRRCCRRRAASYWLGGVRRVQQQRERAPIAVMRLGRRTSRRAAREAAWGAAVGSPMLDGAGRCERRARLDDEELDGVVAEPESAGWLSGSAMRAVAGKLAKRLLEGVLMRARPDVHRRGRCCRMPLRTRWLSGITATAYKGSVSPWKVLRRLLVSTFQRWRSARHYACAACVRSGWRRPTKGQERAVDRPPDIIVLDFVVDNPQLLAVGRRGDAVHHASHPRKVDAREHRRAMTRRCRRSSL